MAQRILRINMTDGSARYQEAPESWRLLAGRGVTSTGVSDEVPPLCHPLGPLNKLFFAPGWVTGTNAPSSGRISVGGKSPLTGGIKESNAGGLAGQKIARLGLKAIIVEGQPSDGKLRVIKINKDGVEFLPADELAGRGMYETDARLGERFGKVAIIGIGPAGEMRMTNAGLSINDMENQPGRYAGRGGLGAVLGSKGVKAIVVDDAGGPGVEIADRERFRAAVRDLVEALRAHEVTSQTLPAYGTAALINVLNEAGGLPTRNFSSGRFEGAQKVSGEAISQLVKERGGEGGMARICHPGCIIKCSNVIPHPDGSAHVSCLEYETVWALGPNCAIDDLDDIAELCRICNDVGLDTIEAGCTLAVAMEGGLLKFGDGKRAIELLKEVGRGTPLGRLLGQGCVFAAQAFGVSRIPAVKGQGMPAYEPRAVKGMGVTYATSPMGADHTAGYTTAQEILGVGGKADPLSPQGKAELSRNAQIGAAFIDCTGYCLFVTFATSDLEKGARGMMESINAVLGTDWTSKDADRIGRQVLAVERRFNLAAGLGPQHDRLPEFMRREPLPPHNQVYDVPDSELDRVHAEL
jgi:aldehyde:ferredoxin oxidoreductase